MRWFDRTDASNDDLSRMKLVSNYKTTKTLVMTRVLTKYQVVFLYFCQIIFRRKTGIFFKSTVERSFGVEAAIESNAE